MAYKILLTGSTGMVGHNLLENNDFSKYDLLTPNSRDLNLLDYASVDNYIKSHAPTLIIHAAGRVGGIQANISHPVSFLVDNLEIGKNVITAARHNGVKNLINLGSSCMYPKDAKNPLTEKSILKGELEPTNEGYALAKIMTSRLCEYINKEDYRFNYKTIIPCNLYGRYDKFDPRHSHMIPAVIKKIYDAKHYGQSTIDVWGDGTARREFMYAEDLTDFIVYAIQNFEKMPQTLNVGLGIDYMISEYYQIIAKVIGYKGGFSYDLSKPVGMKQKLIDDTKLIDFGWQYKTTLEEGIKKTYDFFKSNILINEEL
jgi:GDP-L-fucose synthase